MSGYEALVELAERELEIVSAGAVERLPALHAERAALIAKLPNHPTAGSEPALERAAALQARVTALLEQRLAETGSELRKLARGRTAMKGYAPPVERLKLVDRAG